jgi:predicted ArsR family transcriptional regulator
MEAEPQRPLTGTKRKIVELLKRQSEATAEELAGQLGVSATAVRQHLAVLEAEGFVVRESRARGPGRPAHVWRLTEKAETAFPKQCGLLGNLLLGQLLAREGETKVLELLEAIAGDFAQELGEGPELEDRPLRERIERLVERLNELGAYAQAEVACAKKPLIRWRNCPFYEIAKEYPIVCEMDRMLLSKMLGVPVRIEGTIARGAPCCTFTLDLPREEG